MLPPAAVEPAPPPLVLGPSLEQAVITAKGANQEMRRILVKCQKPFRSFISARGGQRGRMIPSRSDDEALQKARMLPRSGAFTWL
jgi:hypothetical protein